MSSLVRTLVGLYGLGMAAAALLFLRWAIPRAWRWFLENGPRSAWEFLFVPFIVFAGFCIGLATTWAVAAAWPVAGLVALREKARHEEQVLARDRAAEAELFREARALSRRLASAGPADVSQETALSPEPRRTTEP